MHPTGRIEIWYLISIVKKSYLDMVTQLFFYPFEALKSSFEIWWPLPLYIAINYSFFSLYNGPFLTCHNPVWNCFPLMVIILIKLLPLAHHDHVIFKQWYILTSTRILRIVYFEEYVKNASKAAFDPVLDLPIKKSNVLRLCAKVFWP